MDVRSDYALELQLKKTRDEVGGDAVRNAITSVLQHMLSGRSRNRRGGRQLIVLLAEARSQAADAQEWHVVRLLQDSMDYAEGRILQPDFEDRYRLFEDGKRKVLYRDYVGRSLWIANKYAADASEEYLEEHPQATAHEVIENFRSLGQDALFTDAPEDRPGRYRIIRGRAELALWLERILQDHVDVEDPAATAKRIALSPEAMTVLASDTNGHTLLKAAEMQRRSAGLETLRKAAEDPAASEHQLHEALKGQYWIFGGRFVGEAAYRRLVPGDEVDIPLIRGDGSLHIVELKRASSLQAPLVKRHRSAWVPTAQVQDAVGQAVNYLVGLDENRHRIREEFGIDVRRASAAVLIGHPATYSGIPEESVNETLRTLNAHLSRVEVLTYKELIDNAQRSLSDPTL